MGPYSMDLRERALALYDKCHNYSLVGKVLGVSHAWVRTLVGRWQTQGTLEPQYQRCGAPRKIDDAARRQLRRWLEKENDLTLKELQEKLAARNIHVSHTAVDKTLKVLGITRKKNDRRRRTSEAGRP